MPDLTEPAADLTNARVFAERDRATPARWYLLPDQTVWHRREPSSQLERAIHTARDVEGSDALTEITEAP